MTEATLSVEDGLGNTEAALAAMRIDYKKVFDKFKQEMGERGISREELLRRLTEKKSGSSSLDRFRVRFDKGDDVNLDFSQWVNAQLIKPGEDLTVENQADIQKADDKSVSKFELAKKARNKYQIENVSMAWSIDEIKQAIIEAGGTID